MKINSSTIQMFILVHLVHSLIPFLGCFGMDNLVIEKINKCLDRKGNIFEFADNQANTYLHMLTHPHYEEQAKVLIPKLLKQGLHVDKPGYLKKTALYTAVEYCNPSITALLLENKACVNSTSSSGMWTPLHAICSSGNKMCQIKVLSIIASLVLYKADVNFHTTETPLHVICRFSDGTKEMVKRLLESKADTTIKTNYKKYSETLYKDLDNKTALEIAKKYNKNDIVELLIN